MIPKQIEEYIEVYKATELLYDKSYLEENEYNRIVNSQLRTIIGRMAMLSNEESDDK